MIPMGRSESRQHRLACEVLERGSGIDQAAVEEDPAGRTADRGAIGKGERDGASRERGRIHPWQRRAVATQFFLHDPPAGFFHHGMAVPAEFGDKR